MRNNYTINIVGDICLTDDNLVLFKQRKPKKLFNDVLDFLKTGNLNVANLEAPYIKKDFKPIEKTGPCLYIDENVVYNITKAKFNAISLANNHINDYGSRGVLETINKLNGENIDTFGAGENTIKANLPFIKRLGEKKIAFVSYADHEFSIADENIPGANGFDILNSFDQIKKIKDQCDYLIILFHGGIEHYKNPSPLLQKKCRKMIESGADLVTCQHSHCIGTYEKYKTGTIVYGQGNFLFGYNKNNHDWNYGLIIKIDITKDKFNINYFPIEALKEGGIKLLKEKQKDELIIKFHNMSKNIIHKKFVEEEWKKFCESKKSLYLSQLLGHNKYFYFLNKISNNFMIDKFYSKRKMMVIHNLIRCESHQEVIEAILKDYY